MQARFKNITHGQVVGFTGVKKPFLWDLYDNVTVKVGPEAWKLGLRQSAGGLWTRHRSAEQWWFLLVKEMGGKMKKEQETLERQVSEAAGDVCAW